MIDQHRSSIPENRKPHRSGDSVDKAIRDDSQTPHRPAGQVDIIAMIRSLQRSAGLVDCFRTGIADCDIIDCDWRSYCVGTPTDRKKGGKRPKRK